MGNEKTVKKHWAAGPSLPTCAGLIFYFHRLPRITIYTSPVYISIVLSALWRELKTILPKPMAPELRKVPRP